MSDEKVSEDVKKLVTTGPTVSSMFAPDQENLVEPGAHKDNDFERCIQCGYCRNVCRVYSITFSERDYAGGRNRILKALSKKELDFDKEEIIPSIYQCMLCGHCRTVCPVGIDLLEVFQNYRRTAVRKGVLPEKLGILKNSILTNKNPFLENAADRYNWCDPETCKEGYDALQRGIERTRKMKSGELKASDFDEHLVAYFVGCTSSYRNNELSTATCRILDKLKVNWILIPDEYCCGSVMFRTGLEDDAIQLVEYNTKLIQDLGINELVFSCAGCFSTLHNEYPKFMGELPFELSHLVQFVPKIAKQKGLKIRYTKYTKEDPMVITYHDPCHLGRYCGVYDEPRELMNMIEGVKFIEMKHNREMSLCCGAGGGVRALYGEISLNIASNRLDETVACWENINEDRLKEAIETDADVLVSACVFCKNNLHLAASRTKPDLPMIDLSMILEDCEFYK